MTSKGIASKENIRSFAADIFVNIVAKLLPEPMVIIHQLDHLDHSLKFNDFRSRKWIWKVRLQNIGHFVKALTYQITLWACIDDTSTLDWIMIGA